MYIGDVDDVGDFEWELDGLGGWNPEWVGLGEGCCGGSWGGEEVWFEVLEEVVEEFLNFIFFVSWCFWGVNCFC